MMRSDLIVQEVLTIKQAFCYYDYGHMPIIIERLSDYAKASKISSRCFHAGSYLFQAGRDTPEGSGRIPTLQAWTSR